MDFGVFIVEPDERIPLVVQGQFSRVLDFFIGMTDGRQH